MLTIHITTGNPALPYLTNLQQNQNYDELC